MFCQYCGKPNPDDASFCGACGKNIAWNDRGAPRAAAASPAPIAAPAVAPSPAAAAPAPAPVRPEPVHVVSDAEERLVRSILAADQKKDRWKLPNWLGVVAGIAIILMLLPHKDGSSVCDAAHNEVAQQVPFAVEILAARHPLTVGLVREATKESGFVDKLAGVYVQNEMIPQQDPGAASCYIAYYTVMFQKDRVRSSIADWLEAKAHLK